MKVLKQIKPTRLIFLIILLAGNTFAWFIYTSKVDGAISVHVKSWNVVFQADDTQVSSNIDIDVSSVYPGMDDYSFDVTAYNRSEVSATLSYKLLEVSILGNTYVTVEGREENGETPLDTDLTSAQLLNQLANNYPFTITLSISGSQLSAQNGEESCTLEVEWPYEQNDDEEDTRWGIMAATYKENNPTLPSITMRVKLIITQNAS